MRILVSIFLSYMMFYNLASADFKNNSAPATQGGFVGPTAGGEVTVKEIITKSYDDMPVIITGNIVERVSGDKYTFADKTGEILIEIDHKVMPNEIITPETKVRLSGEVDKDFLNKVEVDVYLVEILK